YLAKQVHLGREIRLHGRQGQAVQVVGPRAGVYRNWAHLSRMLGDGLRLPRRDLEMAHVEVVRVRVARAHAGLGSHAPALADGPRRPLDNAVLENELLGHLVLDEDVGVVDAAGGRPHERLQAGLGQAEPVGEEALRAGGWASVRRHEGLPGRGCRETGSTIMLTQGSPSWPPEGGDELF